MFKPVSLLYFLTTSTNEIVNIQDAQVSRRCPCNRQVIHWSLLTFRKRNAFEVSWDKKLLIKCMVSWWKKSSDDSIIYSGRESCSWGQEGYLRRVSWSPLALSMLSKLRLTRSAATTTTPAGFEDPALLGLVDSIDELCVRGCDCDFQVLVTSILS